MELRRLLESGDWSTLWRLAQAVTDAGFKMARIDALMAQPSTTAMDILRWLLGRPDSTHSEVQAYWNATYAGCAAAVAFGM